MRGVWPCDEDLDDDGFGDSYPGLSRSVGLVRPDRVHESAR